MTKAERIRRLNGTHSVLKIGNKKQFLTDGISEWPLIEGDEPWIGDIIIYTNKSKTVTTNRSLLMNVSNDIDDRYDKNNSVAKQLRINSIPWPVKSKSTIKQMINSYGSNRKTIHSLHPDFPTIEGGVMHEWCDFELSTYRYGRLFR